MRCHRVFLIFALFLTLSALTSFAYADSQARIVRLSYVEGDVQHAHQGSGFENATMNVPIVEGDQLRAGSDGWAEIEFEDGSTIRLAPESAIGFSELRLLSSGGTATSVDLDQGEAEFKVTRHDEGEFQVTVRNKTIVLKHSSRFRVTTMNSDPLEVVVWKGEVGIQDRNAGKEIAVKKKETFAQDLLDPSRYDLEKGVEADGLDQWSTQRDEYLSTYAKSNNHANSPYQYGISDLNYYGQYYDVPGYGNMWQPYGVNIGWDPFANGYWSSAPGGYIWVSSYPWGWMPYRFGHWQFVNGYGWLWQPGSWNTWNYCPPVRNAPPGFRPPTPPAPGTIGTVSGGGTPPGTIKPGTGNIGPHGRPVPPVRTTGPGGSRVFIQPEPRSEPPEGAVAGNGNHAGNQGNPGHGNNGQGNPATNHIAGSHENGNGGQGIEPHGRPDIREEHVRPGPTEGGIGIVNVHGSGGEQQHTPPQSIHMAPPPPPARVSPPAPAPVVHPQVTMNPPPRPQYSPPPAPVMRPAPMPMQTAPAPMVHSAPAPAQSSAPGKPR
jgi:hypothetical protein